MKITIVSEEAFSKMDQVSRQQIINLELEKLIMNQEERTKKIEELWREAEKSTAKILELIKGLTDNQSALSKKVSENDRTHFSLIEDAKTTNSIPKPVKPKSFLDRFKR